MLQHEILGKAAEYREPWGMRFNPSDLAYAHRTPAGAGNRKTWTLHIVGKLAQISVQQCLFSVDFGPGTAYSSLTIESSAKLRMVFDAQFNTYGYESSAVLRDPTAPFILTLGCDTTQALAADRFTAEWNGQVFSMPVMGGYSALPQNYDTFVNSANQHTFGRFEFSDNQYFGGCGLQIIFVDGLKLPQSTFTRVKHGSAFPKRFTVVYGANGYHLDFNPAKYGEAVTLANVLKDRSGNGNHFTGVNLDATSTDRNLDHLRESATPKGVQGNQCTWNPLWRALTNGGVSKSIVNGNLDFTGTVAGSTANTAATLPILVGQKRVVEVTLSGASSFNNAAFRFGIIPLNSFMPSGAQPGDNAGEYAYAGTGSKVIGGSSSAYGAAWAANVVIRMEVDNLNGTLEFFRDNVSQGVINFTPFDCWIAASGHDNNTISLNAGTRPYAHTPTSGFLSVHTGTLSKPAIKNPANGFVFKRSAGSAIEADLAALRAGWGASGYVEIFKNVSNAQSWKWRFSDDAANMLSSDSDAVKGAFTAPTAGDTYLGMALRIGAAYGTFATEVAHVNGVATNVAHGLGSARKVALAKRSVGGVGNWFVSHPDAAAGKLLYLNNTNGETTDASITVDATNVTLAAALPSGTYRVMVLAETTGLISLLKYRGNGVSDGANPYFAQRAGFFVVKRLNPGGAWRCVDAATFPTNPVTGSLALESTAIYTSDASIDRLASGMKAREGAGFGFNDSADYVVIAVAEADITAARAV